MSKLPEDNLIHRHRCRQCNEWFRCPNETTSQKECADTLTPLCSEKCIWEFGIPVEQQIGQEKGN